MRLQIRDAIIYSAAIFIVCSLVALHYISPENLKREQLKYGKQQLLTMLEDRPSMAQYVRENDRIWNLTISFFGGDACGRRIQWNPDEPALSGYLSNCRYPTPERNECFIRLRKNDNSGKPIDGELLWSCLFFEFYNLSNYKDFLRIHELALSGSLSRSEFVKMNTECEYRSVVESVQFYENFWNPEMQKREIKSTPAYWIDRRGYQRDRPSFTQWYSQLTDESAYPYNVWGRYFDHTITPYLRNEQLLRAK